MIVAAHTELLQQTREHQRCEAEYVAQIRRLESELEQYRRSSSAVPPSTSVDGAAAEGAQVAELEARVAQLETDLALEQRSTATAQMALAGAQAQIETLQTKLRQASAGVPTDGYTIGRTAAAPPTMVAVSEDEEMHGVAPSPKRPLGESAVLNRVAEAHEQQDSPSKKGRTSGAIAEVTRRHRHSYCYRHC